MNAEEMMDTRLLITRKSLIIKHFIFTLSHCYCPMKYQRSSCFFISVGTKYFTNKIYNLVNIHEEGMGWGLGKSDTPCNKYWKSVDLGGGGSKKSQKMRTSFMDVPLPDRQLHTDQIKKTKNRSTNMSIPSERD